MKSMLLLLGALLVAALLVAPPPAVAASAAVKAKCMAKYPDAGTTAERRRNFAMRRQCIASGGKI